MKRLLLLLLVTASVLSVSAQKDYRGHDRQDRYHNNNKGDSQDRYHYKHKGDRKHELKNKKNRAEFKKQLANINRTFDDRIRSTRRNPFMSGNQKARKVRELEIHRRSAINECMDRFNVKGRKDFADRNRRYR